MELDFDIIISQITEVFNERLAWASGEILQEYIRQNKVALATVQELQQLYDVTGNVLFINLAKKALDDTKNNPQLQDLFLDEKTEELEKEYYIAIENLSKRFLIENLDKFPLNTLIKFFAESIGHGSISKTFIDAMKLSPDAPEELKYTLLHSSWTSINKWHNKVESLEDDILYQINMAKNIALTDSKGASNIYLNTAKSIKNNRLTINSPIIENNVESITTNLLYLRAIICILCEDDAIEASIVLNTIIEEDQDFKTTKESKFCDDLIKSVTNYDIHSFTKAIEEYSLVHLDNETVSLLLKLQLTFKF